MKIFKILIVVGIILALITTVLWLTEDPTSKIDTNHSSFTKEINERIDARWDTISGWNTEAFDNSLADIESKKENKYISDEEAQQCERHLCEVALRKTSASLDSLYCFSGCTPSAVDAQFAGITRIAENNRFASDSIITAQKAMHADFKTAYGFATGGFSVSPGFRFPSTWNSFSSSASSYRGRAASIRSGRYFDRYFSHITVIANGTSESTVNNRINSARTSFASSLAAAIKRSYGSLENTQENISNLRGAIDKYRNEGYPDNGLGSFRTEFITR